LLEYFNKIEILPTLHESDFLYRQKLLTGVKQNKNPDYKIDNIYWELESPSFPYNYNKISQRIRKGAQQANNIILYFEKSVNGFTVQKAINDRFLLNKDLKEVIIIVKNELVIRIKNKPDKQ
jgi:hypothetical protein